MSSLTETNLISSIDESHNNGQLKAVQAARMSTFVLALLTTILTIFT